MGMQVSGQFGKHGWHHIPRFCGGLVMKNPTSFMGIEGYQCHHSPRSKALLGDYSGLITPEEGLISWRAWHWYPWIPMTPPTMSSHCDLSSPQVYPPEV